MVLSRRRPTGSAGLAPRCDEVVGPPPEGDRSAASPDPQGRGARSDQIPTALRHHRNVAGAGDRRDGWVQPTPRDDAPYARPVRFEVLGPLRIVAAVGATSTGARPVERSLGGPKQRLVLALLLAT